MKTIRYLFFILLMGTLSISVSGQSSIVDTLKQQLLRYLDQCNEENVYLHTDKTFYKQGESIYFNLFLTDASTGKPSHISDMACVELYAPDGKCIDTLTIYPKNGTGGGSIYIPHSYAGGLYTLKAYTQWMKNFGEGRYFTKTLTIQKVITPRLFFDFDFEKRAYEAGDEVVATLSVTDIQNKSAENATIQTTIRIEGKHFLSFSATTDSMGKATLKFYLPDTLNSTDILWQSIVDYERVSEAISRSVPIILNTIDLKFYPEGGTWPIGYCSRMAFEALDKFGKGADISGEIIDEEGERIVNFESFHFGMGAFEMTPEREKRYYARILKPLGIDSLFALPFAETRLGLNLNEQRPTAISWNIYASQKTTACLVVRVHGLIYDSKELILEEGLYRVDFNTEELPAGIAVFTLFNAKREPECERLVFVNGNKKIYFDIKTDTTTYESGEKVYVTVTATDESKKPVCARFSMAVVDEQILSFADDKQDNILTYLWLSSELSGKIHEPSFYFNPKEEKSEKAIDYLLLIHGWRRYDWYDIFNIPEKIRYLPEKSFIYGRLSNLRGKPKQGSVILLEKSRDKRVLKIRTNPEGEFVFLNVDKIAGNILFFKKNRNIILSDSLQMKLPFPYSFATPEVRSLLSNYSMDSNAFNDLSLKNRYTKEEILQQEHTSSPILDLQVTLSGMPVRSVAGRSIASHVMISPERSDIFKYPLFGSNVNANPIHFKKMISPYFISPSLGEFPFIAINDMPLIGRGSNFSPLTFFNFHVIHDMVFYPPIEAIARFGHRATGGAIVINTGYYYYNREKSSYTHLEIPIPQHVSAQSSYQLSPRQYGSGATRNRFNTTVFWNSSLTTNQKGEATIEFYNNDETSVFRITIEGVSNSGLIGRGEQTYTTQLPLSMDVKLPHYVCVGDTLKIPVSIRNNTDEELTPSVVLNDDDGFSYAISARKIEPHSLERPLLTLPCYGKTGVKSLSLELSTERFTDITTHSIPVLSPDFPREFSVAGKETRRDAEFDLSDWTDGYMEGDFRLLINPFEELLESVSSLLRQPSGCFEQVSSANFPNIFVMQLMQATGNNDTQIKEQAMKMIRDGYKKLVNYESRDGGFEWYGASPGHEVLSAYGLVQFYEMSRIKNLENVDEKMVDRTLKFLQKRRNSDGTYQQNGGRYGFSGSPQAVGNAYIAYALAEIEKPDTLAYQHALVEALESNDMYCMALIANAAIKQNKMEDYNQLVRLFEQEFTSISVKLKTQASIVRSSTAQTEAIALWAIALMRAHESNWTLIEQCMRYLASAKSGYGYGSTQATALALKAFTDYTIKSNLKIFNGNVEITINNYSYSISYSDKNRQTIVDTAFLSHLVRGKNSISIQFSDTSDFIPYLLSLNWRVQHPQSSERCPLELSMTLADEKVKQNESVRLTVRLENKQDEGQPMSMAIVGLPAGLSPQAWQLKELQEQGVFDYYEILNDKLVFYYRELGPREIKQIVLDLRAEIPGVFTATASSAYLYYSQSERHWLKGLKIIITE